MVKKCLICKKEFITYFSCLKKKHGKFCSRSCLAKSRINKNAANWKGGKIRIICSQCKKVFYVYQVRKNSAIFCSRSCLAKSKVGQNHPNWKGGERYTGEGYILVYSPKHPFARKSGYVKRSRLVMEKIIGRYLKPAEIVHHINNIRDDDRPKNLHLFKNGNEHSHFHQLNKLVQHHKQIPPRIK